MAKKAYIGVGNFSKRNLPSGYTQVEYIGSTGTQYINTGFIPNQGTRVVMEIYAPATSNTSSSEYICGVRTSTSANQFALQTLGGTYSYRYGTQNGSGVISTSITERFKADLNKNIFNVNGVSYTFTAETFTCPNTFTLFAMNNNGTNGYSAHKNMKLYSCQIYDNGTIVRDYVPCTQNGVAGLYDIVNGVFYTNSGTGTFAVGTSNYTSTARKVKKAYVGIQQFEPRELPEGYTQVEYIESSGTQCIDTSVQVKSTIGYEVDFSLMSTSGEQGIIGGFTYGGYNHNFGSYNGQWITQYGNGGQTMFGTTDTKKHLLSQNVVSGAVYFDNKSIANGLTYYDNTDKTFKLFCYNGGSSYPTFWITSMRLYACRMYDNGTLVRDYVPCLNSTGVGGLYDLVNKKFYGNSGTGTFAVGASGSTAHRIKKGYIGIGGVARPFMSGGEVTYYGTITPFYIARYNLAATSVGNYAIFGCGYSAGGLTRSMSAYDTSLTRSKPSDSTNVRERLAATTVGNYALFGGGYSGSVVSFVDFYNTSLTMGTAPGLSESRYDFAATTVGNYALFGGGNTYSSTVSTVDAYNSSLQRTTPTTLAKARKQLAATTVGNYALFGGGSRTIPDSAVDAYDSSLTRTIATGLTKARTELAATSVGNYALFGGDASSEASGIVDVYDESLTRTTAASLSVARSKLAATTVGDFALFGGGSISSGTYYGTVDVYDKSLTRTTTTDLSVPRQLVVATTIGNYALFGGGRDGGNYYSTVDAYTVA